MKKIKQVKGTAEKSNFEVRNQLDLDPCGPQILLLCKLRNN